MAGGKVVVIEDETDILEVIEYSLIREGYQAVSDRDGQAGLELVRREKPSLILLDLMLPTLDGIEICRQLKQDAETASIPIIMVTAKGEEADIVIGLGMGAEDYVTKPFSPRELMARVKAVLRRGSLVVESAPQGRIVRSELEIVPGRHRVSVVGKTLKLTAAEFRLLHFLASHPGRVFTRDQLLNKIAGADVAIIDRNVDVHIRSIRKKLESHQDLIETVWGVGYRFREED